VSQSPAVRMPNGVPYEITEACWDFLTKASAAARYLGVVDPAAFVDRRNPSPTVILSTAPDPEISVEGASGGLSLDLPDLPSLPSCHVYGFSACQPYHIEVWCEKSTMNDVLLPLCRQYEATLVTGLGELSITATLQAVQRMQADGRPARIFYVSDFDPAGACMPVSVARKIEYFLRAEAPDLDVRLFPVVLTLEQVQAYQLPRTPIKESEKRRAGFEGRYGTGAVELDALEAVYPGVLKQLLSAEMDRYYDADLVQRVRAARQVLIDDLNDQRQAVFAAYEDSWYAIMQRYDALRQRFAAEIGDLNKQVAAVCSAMGADLEAQVPDVMDYPVPDGVLCAEEPPALFMTGRDYEAQIAVYKQFQGKMGVEVEEEVQEAVI